MLVVAHLRWLEIDLAGTGSLADSDPSLGRDLWGTLRSVVVGVIGPLNSPSPIIWLRLPLGVFTCPVADNDLKIVSVASFCSMASVPTVDGTKKCISGISATCFK